MGHVNEGQSVIGPSAPQASLTSHDQPASSHNLLLSENLFPLSIYLNFTLTSAIACPIIHTSQLHLRFSKACPITILKMEKRIFIPVLLASILQCAFSLLPLSEVRYHDDLVVRFPIFSLLRQLSSRQKQVEYTNSTGVVEKRMPTMDRSWPCVSISNIAMPPRNSTL